MKSNLSPGGALLRTSRVFSLPKPLKPPPINSSSNTATTGFPVYMSVTTPETSRRHGDWGFKYPLPKKALEHTSTPLIRVKHIDAMESVTDFATASDHSLTLEKFQELNMPISRPPKPSKNATLYPTEPSVNGQMAAAPVPLAEPLTSVFEDDVDFTAMNLEDEDRLTDKRWKFKGPWLGGMSPAQFDTFLTKIVRNRASRHKFYNFLREKLAQSLTEESRYQSVNKGDDAVQVKVDDVTEAQLSTYIRKLREDRPQLYKLISAFYDLAPIRPTASTERALTETEKMQLSTSPYAVRGPPSVHPSAGLSYLRTGSFIENHPLYGPQATKTVHQSRLIKPTRGWEEAKLGLAGFIAEAPVGNTKSGTRYTFERGTYGGTKPWVTARSAKISASGNVQLDLAIAGFEANLLQREFNGEDIDEVPRSLPKTFAPMRLNNNYSTKFGSAKAYGMNG